MSDRRCKSDIVDRAEAALEGRWPGDRIVSPARFFGGLVRELLAELKVARAQRDEFRAQLEHELRQSEL
jgi:hypothetical protein